MKPLSYRSSCGSLGEREIAMETQAQRASVFTVIFSENTCASIPNLYGNVKKLFSIS